MAMIRTRRLALSAAAAVTAAPRLPGPRAVTSVIYTVPSGVLAIIRDVRLTTDVGSTTAMTDMQIWSSLGNYYLFRALTFPAPGLGLGFTCDVVLHDGEQLYIGSEHNFLGWCITGAELPVSP